MDIMQMADSPNFMGHWDVMECPNQEIVLTIDHIKDEMVIANGKKEKKTVCHWREQIKPMILNATNKKTLAKVLGTKDTERMRGQQVVIGTDKVKAFGAEYDALRIRNRRPAAAQVQIQCANCGGMIAPSNGMDVQQLANYTQAKYGMPLCASCATQAAKGGQ